MLKVVFALSLLCTLCVPLQAVAGAIIDLIEIKGLDDGGAEMVENVSASMSLYENLISRENLKLELLYKLLISPDLQPPVAGFAPRFVDAVI